MTFEGAEGDGDRVDGIPRTVGEAGSPHSAGTQGTGGAVGTEGTGGAVDTGGAVGTEAGGAGRTVVIGITGPIGCGKSTVAAWLRELGATVIDADDVAHEVVEPGQPALDEVLAAFGPAVRAADGSLDRSALGRIVFVDPEALARLESIIHPAVRPAILDRIAAASRAGAPAVVVEAIKLVEGGLAALCNEVWLVRCDPLVQRERLLARTAATTDADTSDAQTAGQADMDARIAAQSDIVARLLPAATRVIDTSGIADETRTAVEDAYRAAIGES